MKYYVIVNNGRYLVKVDAQSLGGAEHVVLDNYSGITGAQAFNLEDMGLETFQALARTAEPVSLEELGRLSEEYSEHWADVSRAQDVTRRARINFELAQTALEEAREALAIAEEEEIRTYTRAEDFQDRAFGILPFEIESPGPGDPLPVRRWVELETGALVSRQVRDAILEEKYGFDDTTPASEIFEYFARLEGADLLEIDACLRNEYPAAVREYLAQF